ncbi:MAG: hypothetical protein KAJ46_08765 [Sedimentisphaerales bacterium]|nr:hypothetical protein [Sedimentisphaerales bacterium]
MANNGELPSPVSWRVHQALPPVIWSENSMISRYPRFGEKKMADGRLYIGRVKK